jgi:hypothetical protein
MLGLAATDGRIIRPIDEPTTVQVQFEFREVLLEALTRSVELRRQKWVIKQRELQLVASRNFLLPRLDAVGRYRWRGFGDDLITARPRADEFNTAWQTLTGGDFQEWQIGFQMTVPIGFRAQLAAVRNAQLALARERALLQDQEHELAHIMTTAMRDIDRHYVVSQRNYNARVAAQAEVDAVDAAYQAQTVTFDLLLDAQRRLADSEREYFRSLVDYNISILQLHYRKGSLLEHNGVYLAEGPWPAKAYFDAQRRARERDAGIYINYGLTRPEVFSRGTYPQRMNPPADYMPPGSEAIGVPGQPTPVEEPSEDEILPGEVDLNEPGEFEPASTQPIFGAPEPDEPSIEEYSSLRFSDRGRSGGPRGEAIRLVDHEETFEVREAAPPAAHRAAAARRRLARRDEPRDQTLGTSR